MAAEAVPPLIASIKHLNEVNNMHLNLYKKKGKMHIPSGCSIKHGQVGTGRVWPSFNDSERVEIAEKVTEKAKHRLDLMVQIAEADYHLPLMYRWLKWPIRQFVVFITGQLLLTKIGDVMDKHFAEKHAN